MKCSVSFKNTHPFYIMISNWSHPNQGHSLLKLFQFLADTQVYVPIRVTTADSTRLQVPSSSLSLLPTVDVQLFKRLSDFYVLEVKQKCMPTCVYELCSVSTNVWPHTAQSGYVCHYCEIWVACFPSSSFILCRNARGSCIFCLVVSSWVSVKSLLVKIILTL